MFQVSAQVGWKEPLPGCQGLHKTLSKAPGLLASWGRGRDSHRNQTCSSAHSEKSLRAVATWDFCLRVELSSPCCSCAGTWAACATHSWRGQDQTLNSAFLLHEFCCLLALLKVLFY